MRFSTLLAGRRLLAAAFVVCAALAALPAAAGQFPFDQDLMLDTRPMKGSKRVPMLEIRADGGVLIDLWCNSIEGRFVVADDTVTVLTGAKTERSCPPERERGDEDILSALEQVTNWRREGDDLILIGPQKLRFRRMTN